MPRGRPALFAHADEGLRLGDAAQAGGGLVTFGRQGDSDGCTVAWSAGYRELAAMELDQALGEGEAQAGAFVGAGPGVGDLAERLERLGDVGLFHAAAGVTHGH